MPYTLPISIYFYYVYLLEKKLDTEDSWRQEEKDEKTFLKEDEENIYIQWIKIFADVSVNIIISSTSIEHIRCSNEKIIRCLWDWEL